MTAAVTLSITTDAGQVELLLYGEDRLTARGLLTLEGAAHEVTAHLCRDRNGAWTLAPRSYGQVFDSLSGVRRDPGRESLGPAQLSRSAGKEARKIVEGAVTGWAREHEELLRDVGARERDSTP